MPNKGVSKVDLKDWRRGLLIELHGTPPTTYTNIVIAPDGTLRPWRGIKTTTHPPVLKTDGQITWLPLKRDIEPTPNKDKDK